MQRLTVRRKTCAKYIEEGKEAKVLYDSSSRNKAAAAAVSYLGGGKILLFFLLFFFDPHLFVLCRRMRKGKRGIKPACCL